jgi:hypothetical protein
MAIEMFAETLDNFQHSTRLIPESRSFTKGRVVYMVMWKGKAEENGGLLQSSPVEPRRLNKTYSKVSHWTSSYSCIYLLLYILFNYAVSSSAIASNIRLENKETEGMHNESVMA